MAIFTQNGDKVEIIGYYFERAEVEVKWAESQRIAYIPIWGLRDDSGHLEIKRACLAKLRSEVDELEEAQFQKRDKSLSRKQRRST